MLGNRQIIFHRVLLMTLIAAFAFAVFCLCACSQASPVAGKWYQQTELGIKTLTITDDRWTLYLPNGQQKAGQVDYHNDESKNGNKGQLVLYFGRSGTDRPAQGSSPNQVLYLMSGETNGDSPSMTVNEAAALARANEFLEGRGDSEGKATSLDGRWYREGSPGLNK